MAANAKDRIVMTRTQLNNAEEVIRQAFKAGADNSFGDYSEKGFLFEIMSALGIAHRVTILSEADPLVAKDTR